MDDGREAEIDLTHFCYTEDDRPYLKQPWSRGDFTYATNGHVMVRVPRRADVAENDAAPDPDRVLSNVDFRDLRPVVIPRLPPLRFRLVEDEISLIEGSMLSREICRFAGAYFDLRYVHLLCWLPGLCVGPAADAVSATPFGFEGGGIGCLMPIHRRTEAPEYDFGGLPEPAAHPLKEESHG